MGKPITQRRLYIVVRKRSMWFDTMAFSAAKFEHLFYRLLQLDGNVFFAATSEQVQAYLRAEGRKHFVPRLPWRPVNARRVLTSGAQVRLEIIEESLPASDNCGLIASIERAPRDYCPVTAVMALDLRMASD